MNTLLRRTVLGLTVLLGLGAGIWAYGAPAAFFSSFPGLGLHWIDVSGAYDEHLIRDVGAFYLALGVLSAVALASRSATPGRLAGTAWGVFGLLHLGFHVVRPEGSPGDRVGQVVAPAIAAALGLVLLAPARSRRADADGADR